MVHPQPSQKEIAEKEDSNARKQTASFRNMLIIHLVALSTFFVILLHEAVMSRGQDWQTSVWISLVAFLFVALDVVYFYMVWFRLREKEELEPTWDRVTGVWSAAYFEQKLQAEIIRAGRYRYPVALSVIDIESFHTFNENFGPKRGDELLRQFATTLQGNIRAVDLLARCGDDSFYLLLPHTDVVRAERVIHRLLELAGQELNVPFRAGLTTFRVGENALQLQMRAKAALENAKRSGTKRIQCLISDGENYTAVEF